MLQKVAFSVFCFCVFSNVITALPSSNIITTKWPSLISLNPKCPTIPPWKDIKPTLQDLTSKSLVLSDFQRNFLKEIDDQIKDCENKIVELEAKGIENNDDEKSSTEGEESLTDISIQASNIDNGNEHDASNKTEPNVLETTELLSEIRSIFESLPTFIPIFKSRDVKVAQKVSSIQKTAANKDNFDPKQETDKELNNFIVQYLKSANFDPVANMFKSKQVINSHNRVTEAVVTAPNNAVISDVPSSKGNESTRLVTSALSTTIPKNNIIHLNHIRNPSFYSNLENIPSFVNYVPSAHVKCSHLKPSTQNIVPITPAESTAETNVPVNSANYNPTSLEIRNSPSSNTVPENSMLAVIPSQILENTSPVSEFSNASPPNYISSNILPRRATSTPISNSFSINTESRCSCSPSTTFTPFPFNDIPSKAKCNDECKKNIENTKNPDIVFFKPKEVELMNVHGNLLKKIKVTVLVPTHITQINL